MTAYAENNTLFSEQTEKKPNVYAANAMIGVVAVIAIVFILNETGVFEVERALVTNGFVISAALLLLMQIIVRNERWVVDPMCKYIIMAIVLLLIFALTILLNIHAVMAFLMPILLATQYRSYRLSLMSLIGSCLCCLVAPILSYLLGTWSLTFLTGYIETFCDVSVFVTPGSGIGLNQAIYSIIVYWAMPQMLTIFVFGIILFAVTRSGIEDIRNQAQIIELSSDLNRQLKANVAMQEKILCSMSDIIESRDVETGGHVRRTSEIVSLLLNSMRLDPENRLSDEYIENVVKAAPMHDIGKIAISDSILHKPGRLTEEEYALVKKHPEKSEEIINTVLSGIENENFLITARHIAKYHHERYDGTGYPCGLRGNDIPLEARIMALADVYDALVSERCYKAPMSFEEAYKTIEDSMGTQFDPSLNKYFVACRPMIESFYSGA